MGQNSEQRVIDLVGRSQCELSQGSVLFVFRELGLELHFFFIQFALFIEPAKEFILGQIAFVLALLEQFLSVLKLCSQFGRILALQAPQHYHERETSKNEGQQVDRQELLEVEQTGKGQGY